MSSPFCYADTKNTIIATRYIIAPLHMTSAIFVLTVFYIHIKSFLYTKKMKISKTVFIVSSALYFSCSMALAFGSIDNFYQCFNYKLHNITRIFASQFYSLQGTLLVAILYYRLYYIFKGTAHGLSKCTNIFFWIFYIIMALSSAVACYTVANNHTAVSGTIVSVAFMLLLILIIFLDTLFIFKLYTTDSGDNALKRTIIKNSTLAFISTTFSIIFAPLAALYASIDTAWMELLFGVFYNIDVTTNVICVLLAFRYFEGYYDKICSCCHVKCDRLWRSKHSEELDGNKEAMSQTQTDISTSPGMVIV